jgi:outer membrane protein W
MCRNALRHIPNDLRSSHLTKQCRFRKFDLVDAEYPSNPPHPHFTERYTMKKLLLAVVVMALVVAVAAPSNAQGKMEVGIGADVLLPMGTFGDASGIGFGGSARGQYNFTPMLSAGVTVGYYTWSSKDRTVGTTTVKGAKLSGIPLRVFGKYYFMPEGKLRVYGIAELGFFIASVTVPAQTFGVAPFIFTTPEATASETDFNYAPGIGIELPAGKMTWDVSVRYDGIATTGSTSGSIGARVGVNFPI